MAEDHFLGTHRKSKTHTKNLYKVQFQKDKIPYMFQRHKSKKSG